MAARGVHCVVEVALGLTRGLCDARTPADAADERREHEAVDDQAGRGMGEAGFVVEDQRWASSEDGGVAARRRREGATRRQKAEASARAGQSRAQQINTMSRSGDGQECANCTGKRKVPGNGDGRRMGRGEANGQLTRHYFSRRPVARVARQMTVLRLALLNLGALRQLITSR